MSNPNLKMMAMLAMMGLGAGLDMGSNCIKGAYSTDEHCKHCNTYFKANTLMSTTDSETGSKIRVCHKCYLINKEKKLKNKRKGS